MSEWNPTANQIFLDALDIQPGDRQRAFLDQACGQDAQLRQEVEGLLAAHRESDTSLEEKWSSTPRKRRPSILPRAISTRPRWDRTGCAA